MNPYVSRFLLICVCLPLIPIGKLAAAGTVTAADLPNCESAILNEGLLVCAVNFGSATGGNSTVCINGMSHVLASCACNGCGADFIACLSINSTFDGNYRGGQASALGYTGDMLQLLSGIAGNGAGGTLSLDISGLTAGRQYLFQTYWEANNFGQTSSITFEGSDTLSCITGCTCPGVGGVLISYNFTAGDTNLDVCFTKTAGSDNQWLQGYSLQEVNSYYWDLHNCNAGATTGTTASGTWDNCSTNWNVNSDGSGSNYNWYDGAEARFAAGTDASGASCVTVCGAKNVGGLYFEDGTFSLTGATITLDDCTPVIDVAAGRTANIANTLAGTNGLTKTGCGTLNLTGAISATGDRNINGGTLDFSGSWRVCNGETHTIRCGADLVTDAAIQVGRCSTGTMTLTGCGSTVSNTAGSLIVGRNCGGNGTLNVLAGADASMTGLLVVGRCSGSVGSVLVDGCGSTLNGGTGIRVGRSSSGANTLTVSNCAIVCAGGTLNLGQNACSNGTLNICSGGNVSMTNLNIGLGCGSTGAVNLSGCGSTITASSNVFVGRSAGGSTGSLTLNAGGIITANNINIYSGGSVTVNADERIADSTNINLDGGTLTLASNVQESVDTFTLSSTSNIVYNADADLTVQDFSMTAGQTLTITGWTNFTHFNAGQVSVTSFRVSNTPGTYDKNNISVNGNTGVFDFMDGGDGYHYLVLTTPEPSTYITIGTMLVIALYHAKRRKQSTWFNECEDE